MKSNFPERLTEIMNVSIEAFPHFIDDLEQESYPSWLLCAEACLLSTLSTNRCSNQLKNIDERVT